MLKSNKEKEGFLINMGWKKLPNGKWKCPVEKFIGDTEKNLNDAYSEAEGRWWLQLRFPKLYPIDGINECE